MQYEDKFQMIIDYGIENFMIIKTVSVYAFIISIAPGLPFVGVHDWLITNHQYINIMLIALSIDHLFGTITHLFYTRDFSIIKNIIGISLKIFIVTTVGVLFECFSVLVVEEDWFYKYIKLVLRLIVFLYPARSALKNCFIITYGKFPPEVLLKRFDLFQKTLNVQDLKPKDEEKDDNADSV